jgi:hypothetical protein
VPPTETAELQAESGTAATNRVIKMKRIEVRYHVAASARVPSARWRGARGRGVSSRAALIPKERFAHPFLATRALNLSPGGGWVWATRPRRRGEKRAAG